MPDETPKMHVWESVGSTSTDSMNRLRVPGGWLYESMANPGEDTVAVALAFVPDPPAERAP